MHIYRTSKENQQFSICHGFAIYSVKILILVKAHVKQLNKRRASISVKTEQLPAFDVALAFMLFRIIYSARAAIKFS